MAVMTQSNNSSVAVHEENAAKMDLIKRTICKGATNDEIEMFLHACKRTELDPFMRQIYFVKMGGNMTIQTGIDGYRLIAERSKRYMPGKDTSFVYDKAGKLFSATSYIKKLGPDNAWHEIAATAIFSEYVGNGPLWKSKPHIMISKCSESLALRKAFPADLSGLYTHEEMESSSPLETSQVKNCKAPEHKEADLLIYPDEAEEIELLLANEDASYREDLLKYFTNACRCAIPMSDFSLLPRKFYSSCVRSINKRRLERAKKEQIAQEDENNRADEYEQVEE